MSGKDDSGPGQRPIDAAAKAAFLAALRGGARREDAPAAAGFSLMGFYGARRRDPAFAAGWEAALALPPAAERRVRAYAERGEVRIAPANRRLLQRRRRRHVRFDAARRELYLTHLAGSCDARAAAEAAGVHPSTARLHRRMDPVFDAACREALAEGLVFLEAEVLRLRLEAQRRLRAAIERAGPAARVCADEAAEFDRVMRLLDRHDRKPRRAERGFREGGRRQRWTFDMAIVALDKRLRALGLRRPGPPGEEEGEGEGGE